MDKAALRRAILAQLEAELATLTAAAHDAHAEATDEENRAEDKYDMRSQSAAYLAAGQAKLATELGAAIGAYQSLALPAFGPEDAIATGALVTLEAITKTTDGEPLRGLIQDHVGMGVWLTKQDTFLSRDEFAQMLFSACQAMPARSPWPVLYRWAFLYLGPS